MFFSWFVVLKLSKEVHFLQFRADLSKKSRSIKAVYINVPGRPRYTFSENGIVYYAMTYCFGDISIWNWRILLNFYWVSIFFDILNAYISWTVAGTPCKRGTFSDYLQTITQKGKMEARQMTPFIFVFETILKSKTWGANYKIGEACWNRQCSNDFVLNCKVFVAEGEDLVQLSPLHTMEQEGDSLKWFGEHTLIYRGCPVHGVGGIN